MSQGEQKQCFSPFNEMKNVDMFNVYHAAQAY